MKLQSVKNTSQGKTYFKTSVNIPTKAMETLMWEKNIELDWMIDGDKLIIFPKK